MSVSLARKVAFEVLRRVETEGAFASDVLHARLERVAERRGGLKPEDAALATELTLGALRWQGLLDFSIERYTGKPATTLDAEVRLALRLGLYQLRFLTRIPARAAVNESVELVKAARKRSAAALVNAVLRRAAGESTEPAESFFPAGLPRPEWLGLGYSHPTWLVERWLVRFGEETTIRLLETNNRPAPLTCIVHEPDSREAVEASLQREDLHVAPGLWLRSAVHVQGGSPARSEAFRRGRISIQDEASQMVPLLVDVGPGDSVLDVCAAPGGKTQTLARAAGAGALVIAADRHAHRLRTMREQLKRVGISHVHLVALDGANPLPFSCSFNRILVDAPCSGTGTLARNPEIRWRLKPDDLSQFHGRQVALLRNALNALAPGGRLVYATCSLEPEENEAVVDEVLREQPGVRLVDAQKAVAKHLLHPGDASRFFDAHGFFRTLPFEHGTDGFVAAVLERATE